MDGILSAFRQHSLVGLAEAHGLQEEHDLIVALVSDPRFAATARVIVVEFANALYQGVIDRFTSGRQVPLDELRQAWRNTGFSPFAPWDAPVYERFFVTVRDVNRNLPPQRRIRIVAADPPIDWSKSKVQIEAARKRYPPDPHFYDAIRREVIARRKKALLLFGGTHLYRHWWDLFATGREPQNLIDFLEPGASRSVS